MFDRKEHYKKNREKLLQQQRDYRAKNPDVQKRYRDSEKGKETIKKYCKANKEKYREGSRKWASKHRQQNSDSAKRFYHKNKEHCRDLIYKRKFGISLELYNKLLIGQNETCPICNRAQTQLKRKLCVDHNHETGTV